MISILPLAVLILIVLSAMLAASETALFSMARLEHTREQMSLSVQRALDRLMRRPLESLIVIIGLNEACNIFAPSSKAWRRCTPKATKRTTS